MEKYTHFSMLLSLLFIASIARSAVTLPNILSDGMVIQHNEPFQIYGTATAGEQISVLFKGQMIEAQVQNGFWSCTLPPQSAGGPFDIEIRGDENRIVISDIYFGLVLLCSGQSNMEWPASETENGQEELKDADYNKIRLYTVHRTLSSHPMSDIAGSGWKTCNTAHASDFSAIGFFVARDLYKKYGIPIGVIDNAWGGSELDTWMGEETFHDKKEYKDQIAAFKTVNYDPVQSNEKIQFWMKNLDRNDLGLQQKWWLNTDFKDWNQMQVPGQWEATIYPAWDGIVWAATTIDIPNTDGIATLTLGMIDDSDVTYINGVEVGSMLMSYNKLRTYIIPPSVLKKGKNTLFVKITDTGGGGGISGNTEQLKLMVGKTVYPLAGMWHARKGTAQFPFPIDVIDQNTYPTSKYNAMMVPLHRQKIGAVLWYQGESDTDNALDYQWKFKRFIQEIRTDWVQPDLPFIYVQLANYLPEHKVPTKDGWAELREAQTMALDLNYTAMIPAIDIGDPEDIHPRNKLTIAQRMLPALSTLCFNDPHPYALCKPMSARPTKEGLLVTFSQGVRIKQNGSSINGFAVPNKAGGLSYATDIDLIAPDKILIKGQYGSTGLIRYLWAANPGPIQLYDTNNVPVPPFQIVFE